MVDCFIYDDTNQTACEDNTIGITCEWFAEETLCDPPRQECSNFDNQQSDCFNTFFCNWNPNNLTCTAPEGPAPGQGNGVSPGCVMLPEPGLCNNMSGKCAWQNGKCGGIANGLACTDINSSTFCNAAPIFPTCCAWNSGACNTTFSSSCFDNMQEPPTGAKFCEDYNAVRNQTLCQMIISNPWYMPCKWNNQTTNLTTDDRCEFNGGDLFGGGGGFNKFEDIGSKQSCEAAGGIWKSETFVTSNGNVQNDNWCEMNFGKGTESCDSSCWACEFQPNGQNWPNAAAAESGCEGSSLGYCKWRDKTQFENAPNGLGSCEKSKELNRAGCGIQTTCADYQYYTNPQQACNEDRDCKWMTDFLDPTKGSCANANTKTCQQSCGQCLTQATCLNNGTSCQWDTNIQLCKQGGGSGASSSELCFDGVDNDNDGMTDCADSNCLSDPFCGGGTNANCWEYATNTSCNTDGAASCAWVNDTFTGNAWCDIKGANCWQFDDEENQCSEVDGCSWHTGFFGGQTGFCDVNQTFFSACWGLNTLNSCNGNGNCTWKSFQGGDGGFCDAKPFSCMDTYYGNQSGCNLDSFCNWTSDPFFPGGGRCEALCFGLSGEACSSNPMCQQKAGFCEPDNFAGGGCFTFDGNLTGCQTKDKCTWVDDPFFDNDSQGLPNKGWCNDAFLLTQFQGMEGGEPTIIAIDSDGCGLGGIASQSDICGIGIKDMKNTYGFGMKVDSLSTTMMCNGKALQEGGLGSGDLPASFYLYLDSDNNATNNCNASNNEAIGFEFFFKYETSESNNQLSESKLSYRCVNRTWGNVPISITTWAQKSCQEMGAAILAIDKGTLEGYTEFNKTANMRVYGTAANDTGREATPSDTAGPGYYIQGSVDFMAEDCKGLSDMDGDGCLPSEDPDCEIFNKFGYIPFEDCWNSIDDNLDGKVDCEDDKCKYDQFACGGSLQPDANDKTPPTLAQLEVRAMPDGAFVDINTFEPANASLKFYKTSSTCSALNKTIVDNKFIPWHGIPLDNFNLNPNRLGYELTGNVSYYFKYTLCDISGNCLASACTNFTTPLTYADCGRKCNTFLNPMEFTPPSGTNSSSPLGFLMIRYDLNSDGTYDVNKSYGESSTKRTINETRLVNIKMENPNSSTPWAIECINGTLPSSVTFNSSNLVVNETAGNGIVGMPTSEYNKFITNFQCKRIRITVPYNGDTLYHCTNTSVSGAGVCTDVTSSATKVSNTATTSTWEVDPAVLGFSYYQSSATGSSGTSSSGGGGGGGGMSSSVDIPGNREIGITVPSTGVSKKIGLNGKATFSLKLRGVREEHSVTVTEIELLSTKLTFASKPQTVKMMRGEQKEIDLNLDGVYDLLVKVEDIRGSGIRYAQIQLTSLPQQVPVKQKETTREPVQEETPQASPEEQKDTIEELKETVREIVNSPPIEPVKPTNILLIVLLVVTAMVAIGALTMKIIKK